VAEALSRVVPDSDHRVILSIRQGQGPLGGYTQGDNGDFSLFSWEAQSAASLELNVPESGTVDRQSIARERVVERKVTFCLRQDDPMLTREEGLQR